MNNAELVNWALRMLPKRQATVTDGVLFDGGKATQKNKPSPHSSHDLQDLWKRARKAFPGEAYAVYDVANTNSMEPLFDDNCKVIMEVLTPAVLKAQPLSPGDIVIYENKELLVIHRLQKKATLAGQDAWLIGGDNNYVPDGFIRTPSIKSRLVGILYGKPQREDD